MSLFRALGKEIGELAALPFTAAREAEKAISRAFGDEIVGRCAVCKQRRKVHDSDGLWICRECDR